MLLGRLERALPVLCTLLGLQPVNTFLLKFGCGSRQLTLELSY